MKFVFLFAHAPGVKPCSVWRNISLHNLSPACRKPSLYTLHLLRLLPSKTHKRSPPFKNLLSELKKYTSAKAGSVGEREILTINRCVNAYLASTKDPFSKRSAADFVDNLEGSAYSRNRYIKKSSAFSRWFATRTDEELRNPFEGMGVRETTAPMDRRPAYTLSDLKRLHIAIKEAKDWRCWIILICQYSGI